MHVGLFHLSLCYLSMYRPLIYRKRERERESSVGIRGTLIYPQDVTSTILVIETLQQGTPGSLPFSSPESGNYKTHKRHHKS